MGVDSQIQTILDQFAKYQVPPIESLAPQAAREVYLPGNAAEDVVATHVTNRMVTLASPMPEPVGAIHHHRIQTPDAELMARVYYPKGDGPFPAVVYFHGGGFVIANLNTYDPSCRALCNAAKAAIISVAYRQAPENPFPAAVNDAYHAMRHVQQHAAALQLDPDRIAIAGESAGGNLAAVTCLNLRDRGEQLPVHQVLVYPVVQWSETPTYREQHDAKPLNTPMMQWFKKHYLSSAEDALNPLASPLLASTLGGLPPATVIAAENDPLRAEGRQYADRLAAEGVPTTYTLYPGSVHEFFGMAGLVTIAKQAVKKAADELQGAFSQAGAHA